MPRQPKPYLHRGWYVTNVGGHRHRLCPAADGVAVAKERLLDLLMERRQSGSKRFPRLTVAEVAALFLESRQKKVHPRSYRGETRWLTRFAKLHAGRQAAEITRLEAQQFIDGLLTQTWLRADGARLPYRPKSINHALAALKLCWGWAIETDLLAARNPFDKIPMLPTEGRERVMSEDEFQALLRNAPAPFRRVLIALRYTAARPGELRRLTWSMVDWKGQRLILPRHKGRRLQKIKKPRLIPFPRCVEKLLRWLERRAAGRSPFVFLNHWNRPWGYSLCAAMRRARRRAGIHADENGEQLVLYSNRHTYITTAAAEGIDGPMLQNLAGHTNPQITARYAHLANKHMQKAALKVTEALRPQRRKAEGPNGPPA